MLIYPLCLQNLRNMLDRYERSISLNHFALRQYEVPPRHLILSSETPTRYVIPFPSYAAIREFEGREHKIKQLVYRIPYLIDGYTCAGLIHDNTHEEMIHTAEGMKRALWLCNDIADLEAASWTSLDDVPEWRRLDRHLAGHHCRACETASGTPEAREDRLVKNPVRTAQLELLQSLSTVDLARLVVLLFLTRHGFMDFLIENEPDAEVDRELCQEWCTSIGEATLRHGVFFLHPQIHGGNRCLLDRFLFGSAGIAQPLILKAAEVVTDLIDEIHQWEQGGPDMLPGLNMTVQGTFRRRVGCDVEHSLHFAAQLVRGKDVKCDHCKKVIATA